MLSTFKASRKIFYFPVRWANSVTNWCLGLNSPTGTIRVKNTANPGESGASIDVDIETVATKLRKILDLTYLTASSFVTNLAKRIDGTSIVHENGTIRVSEDWVKRMTGQTGSGKSVDNLVVYQIFRVEGSSHYWGVPITMQFKNGTLTGCTYGSAIDLFTNYTANEPVIS